MRQYSASRRSWAEGGALAPSATAATTAAAATTTTMTAAAATTTPQFNFLFSKAELKPFLKKKLKKKINKKKKIITQKFYRPLLLSKLSCGVITPIV